MVEVQWSVDYFFGVNSIRSILLPISHCFWSPVNFGLWTQIVCNSGINIYIWVSSIYQQLVIQLFDIRPRPRMAQSGRNLRKTKTSCATNTLIHLLVQWLFRAHIQFISIQWIISNEIYPLLLGLHSAWFVWMMYRWVSKSQHLRWFDKLFKQQTILVHQFIFVCDVGLSFLNDWVVFAHGQILDFIFQIGIEIYGLVVSWGIISWMSILISSKMASPCWAEKLRMNIR